LFFIIKIIITDISTISKATPSLSLRPGTSEAVGSFFKTIFYSCPFPFYPRMTLISSGLGADLRVIMKVMKTHKQLGAQCETSAISKKRPRVSVPALSNFNQSILIDTNEKLSPSSFVLILIRSF